MRWIIVGAGGVGGYFGARLARAGTPVTFLARGAHLDALRRHGLTVRSSVEGEYTVPVEAVDKVASGFTADAVLLCVKSFDTETAVEQIRPAVGPETPVLSLQNGVDNEDRIDALLGPGHAVGGAAYVFVSIETPGVIAHRFGGRIVFGELNGHVTDRARRLLAAFEQAGVPVELSPDIRRVLWEKYIFISAQAGMTALSRAPIGVIRATPEAWRLYRTIVEELAHLAAAASIPIAPDAVESIMKAAAALAPQAASSMAHDLGEGKRLELEALHGYAVRLADRLGVAVPTVFAIYAALKPHADGRASQPAETGRG